MAADPDRTAAGALARDRRVVERLLRSGLVVAYVLMAVGVVVKLVDGGRAAPAVRLGDLLAPGDLGDGIIAGGILALALTPAARVVALVVLWWRERDLRFVATALAVVATLGIAVLAGHG